MEKNHGFWDKVDQDMKVMNKKNDEYKKWMKVQNQYVLEIVKRTKSVQRVAGYFLEIQRKT